MKDHNGSTVQMCVCVHARRGGVQEFVAVYVTTDREWEYIVARRHAIMERPEYVVLNAGKMNFAMHLVNRKVVAMCSLTLPWRQQLFQ